MNRIAPSRVGVHAFLVILGLCPFPGHALARNYAAPSLGVTPLSLPTYSPAAVGGAASFSAPVLPAINLGVGLRTPVLPTAAISPLGAVNLSATPAEGRAVQAVLADFSAQLTNNAQGQAPTSAEIRQASERVFDGAPTLNMGDAGGGSIGGGNGGDGSGGGRNGGDGEGRRKGPSDPRVVMIVDTLEGEASETLVSRIEKLADLGVRVVFITARPDKGPNSADEVLLSKLRVRVNNPVIAVTNNGARIIARSSRAENPKPLLADQDGFAAPVIESFRKINADLSKTLGGAVRELGSADAETPHVYGVELPEGADASKAASFYNSKLRRAGYAYKVEVRRDASGRQFLQTQSTALRLNVGRIFNGLFAQHPNLRDDLRREEVTILLDSSRAPKFVKALREEETIPGRGFHMPTVKSSAELESALGGILGVEALKKERVTRYMLRTYMEWKEQIARWGQARSGGGGGGSRSMQPKAYSKLYRQMAFYRGVIMYDLMGRIYKTLRKGQYFDASPEAAKETLRKMWEQPLNNGVRLSAELEEARSNPATKGLWRTLSKGYLDTAEIWLENYYKRNFPGEWPSGVNRRVMGTLINLAQDGKNQIKVEYTSPVARYEISMLPARTNVYRGADGHWVLEGHVYRTGAEPYQEEFEDSIEKNLLAHAMLRGYADPRDGKWYVNGEADPRVRIVFHYQTRSLDATMTPEEVGQDAANITTLISEMLANPEFMEYWEEQEAANAKVADKAAHAKEARAAKAKAQRDARAARAKRRKPSR